jgi:hypothetical protein
LYAGFLAGTVAGAAPPRVTKDTAGSWLMMVSGAGVSGYGKTGAGRALVRGFGYTNWLRPEAPISGRSADPLLVVVWK